MLFYLFVEWFACIVLVFMRFFDGKGSLFAIRVSFYCSVLDLKRILHLWFNLCWFGSKVCSFMSFTTSFLVRGGVKNIFCKFFRVVLVESVCLGNCWRCLSWVVMPWTKLSPRQYIGNNWCSVKLSGWVYRTSFVTHILTRRHLSSWHGDWGSDVAWVAKGCSMVSPRKSSGNRLLMFKYVCFLCVWCCDLTNCHWLVTPTWLTGHLSTSFGEWWTNVCLVANTCTRCPLIKERGNQWLMQS